jgi:hypothetical protein
MTVTTLFDKSLAKCSWVGNLVPLRTKKECKRRFRGQVNERNGDGCGHEGEGEMEYV